MKVPGLNGPMAELQGMAVVYLAKAGDPQEWGLVGHLPSSWEGRWEETMTIRRRSGKEVAQHKIGKHKCLLNEHER